jgi:hypothetical protein
MITGLSIRISLSLAKQKWAHTFHNPMSYILLHLITLIIVYQETLITQLTWSMNNRSR